MIAFERMHDEVPLGPTKPEGNVTRLTDGDREFFLVGTAHISKQSVEEVRQVIREIRPDAVCVELDAGRHEALLDERRAPRLDALDALRRGRAGLVLSSLLFAGFQKRLGDRLGVRPGAEMLAAADEASRIGARVVLADREIQTTLVRCYESLGSLDRAKVSFVLSMLPFAAGDIDESDVEQLKNRGTIGDVMASFAREMPALERPLIDERDRFLIAKVRAANGRRVVAVVGAAHVAGMVRNFRADIDVDRLSEVPPARSNFLTSLALPLSFCALLILASLRARHVLGSDLEAAVTRAFTTLAIPTALGGAIAVVIAGGGVRSTLLTLVVGPLTLFAPFISLGRIAGTAEARARPPAEADKSRIRSDVILPKLARRNSALRPLLIAVLAPVGRTLGFAVGIVYALASRLLF